MSMLYYGCVYNHTGDISMKTAFIGHRKVFAENIGDKLADAIKNELSSGCREFTMGTHGEFDKLALYACRQLQKEFGDLKIEVVITRLNPLMNYTGSSYFSDGDVKTVMYDIETAHYKRQITLSNRKMIDCCDTLICYVDTASYRSGAKTALQYAEKKGLKIINLYRKEEQPFYGMSREQIDEYIKNFIKT